MGIDLMVVPAVVVALMVAGPFERRQARTDFHQLRLASENRLQFRQIALEAHARDQIEFRTFRALQIFRVRLEMMGIAIRADEVDHFHPLPADLAHEVG